MNNITSYDQLNKEFEGSSQKDIEFIILKKNHLFIIIQNLLFYCTMKQMTNL